MERFDFNNVTPVEQGGTGETNAKDAANKFINSLPTGSGTPTDEDFYISQYANGGAQNPVNNEFYRRPLKVLWNYIKAKTDAIYAAVSHKHAAGDITSGTLPIGRGGTGLNASPSILINLAATVADSVFKSAPRPGVTGVLPIANGGTGGDTFVKSASISGKVISLNMSDGTTETLTTQDTAPFTARATSIGGASTTKPAVVVTTYRSGTKWYRKWSDGWIEQGELVSQAGAKTYTVTFPIAFTATPHVQVNPHMSATTEIKYNHLGYNINTTSFTAYTGTTTDYMSWYACGY